ncbi:hypothetical protein B0H14DRAFT_2628536 [Mycena olivaceomarginata]|nr:hypothetical protein B0H14DRAFT_2628536 [Mycena olivaceomarginata]
MAYQTDSLNTPPQRNIHGPPWKVELPREEGYKECDVDDESSCREPKECEGDGKWKECQVEESVSRPMEGRIRDLADFSQDVSILCHRRQKNRGMTPKGDVQHHRTWYTQRTGSKIFLGGEKSEIRHIQKETSKWWNENGGTSPENFLGGPGAEIPPAVDLAKMEKARSVVSRRVEFPNWEEGLQAANEEIECATGKRMGKMCAGNTPPDTARTACGVDAALKSSRKEEE